MKPGDISIDEACGRMRKFIGDGLDDDVAYDASVGAFAQREPETFQVIADFYKGVAKKNGADPLAFEALDEIGQHCRQMLHGYDEK